MDTKHEFMKYLYVPPFFIVGVFITMTSAYARMPSLDNQVIDLKYEIDNTTIPDYLEFYYLDIEEGGETKSALFVNNSSSDDVYFVVPRHNKDSRVGSFTDEYYDKAYNSKETLDYVPLFKDSPNTLAVWVTSDYVNDPFYGWIEVKPEKVIRGSGLFEKTEYVYVGYLHQDGKDYPQKFFNDRIGDVEKLALRVNGRIAIPTSDLQESEDNRVPGNLTVPSGSSITITTIHAGEVHETKGKIVYSFNSNSDTKVAQNSQYDDVGVYPHSSPPFFRWDILLLIVVTFVWFTQFGIRRLILKSKK